MEWLTNNDVMNNIAKKIKNIRKIKKITQKELSSLSNVSYGSIKRFEETGEIALSSLIQIAYALGIRNELENLFNGDYYSDISEVIHE